MNGLKTLSASFVVALSGWLVSPDVVAFLAQYPGYVSTGIGLLFTALRFATSGPVKLPWQKD